MFILFIALLWSGCSPADRAGTPAASPAGPLPTTISAALETAETREVLTSAADPSPAVTATLPATMTPAPATSTPALSTLAPTPSLTPTPGLPQAAIQILGPGPASKIISPFKVSAYLDTGAKGSVHLELIGEDGRLLVRKILSFDPGRRVHLYEDMEFEINGAAEAGRLQISTEDTYGRMNALASVDLVLLSMGSADINPPGDLLEEINIQEPSANILVQGGSLTVSGLARPVHTDPLIFELIDTSGKPIGPTRLLPVPAGGGGSFAPFTIVMPYSVSQQTWALLVISERGGRVPGVTYATSRPILLSP